MLDYGTIVKNIKNNINEIKGKDKKKAEQILQYYRDNDGKNIERIVRYWIQSNSPILNMLNVPSRIKSERIKNSPFN